MKKTLSAKQQRFVEEYLLDANATQAAKRAGYSEKTAHRIGAENMQKPAIVKAIEAANEKRSERTQVTADDVVRELARLGFSDVRRLFTPGGALRRIHDLDDDTAAAISSIEVVTKELPRREGEEVEVEYVHKIKMADKIRPLEMIGKHMGKRLGQWTEKLEHTGRDGGPIESVRADISPEEASKLYREMLAGR